MKPTSALLLTLAILTSGCAMWTAFADPTPPPTETMKTMCRKLQETRPTYDPRDTEETKQRGLAHLNRLDAVCPR